MNDSTPEQADDLTIGPNGVDIWWPELDVVSAFRTFLSTGGVNHYAGAAA